MNQQTNGHSLLRRYGVSVAVVIVSILFGAYLPALSPASFLFILLPAIFFSTWYGGLGPGVFATFVGTSCVSYYLMAPQHSFVIDAPEEVLRLSLFVAISLVMVFLLSRYQVAQRRVVRVHEDLIRLTTRMNMVREEEQAKLARELHDQLGGLLALLKIDVSIVKRDIKEGKSIEARTGGILTGLDDAIATIQRIAMELRPSLLDDHGLPAAMETYLDANCLRVELECKKEIDHDVQIEPACRIVLFRILQEAFTNIVRHAKANQIIVRLRQDGSNTTLDVCDNGIGIEHAQILRPSSLGIMGMRERIRPFRGTVTFAGSPRQGTTVTVVVPRRGHS